MAQRKKYRPNNGESCERPPFQKEQAADFAIPGEENPLEEQSCQYIKKAQEELASLRPREQDAVRLALSYPELSGKVLAAKASELGIESIQTGNLQKRLKETYRALALQNGRLELYHKYHHLFHCSCCHTCLKRHRRLAEKTATN